MTKKQTPATSAVSNDAKPNPYWIGSINLSNDQLTAIAAYWRGCIDRRDHPEKIEGVNTTREGFMFAYGQMNGFERAFSILFGDPFDVIEKATSFVSQTSNTSEARTTNGGVQ